MKLEYLLDIGEESCNIPHTAGLDFRCLPFYLETYGHFYAGSRYFTEREGDDKYLVFYTLSGKGLLRYRNGEYLLQPNQAAVIHCKEYQYYRTFPDSQWEFKWMHFNGPSCSNYMELLNGTGLAIVEIADVSSFNRYFEEIEQLIAKKDILADIEISRLLTEIMTELLKYRYRPERNEKYMQYSTDIDRIVHYIHNNYSRRISTDDFANIVHLSKYHFMRVFKTHTGTSPYEYLIKHRINQARLLLKNTRNPVNEISCHVGYGNVNNFIRDFKKYVGTTPKKYRDDTI